ncbi:MAG TPA: acyl-CoA thioesterase domain-containing protein [Frankiaceae bacterium]|jgi:acyl-CoA thioesterase-2|nr:acyl-CoA thioesterase domain-containing protein [Frankiaceae bacterium]
MGFDGDTTLEEASIAALDGLLDALVLKEIGEDRFAVAVEPDRFGRLFGGQLVAQALLAAAATVEGKPPHSLHAYFVEGGMPGVALELAVERVRDGRSMAARRVSVTQEGRDLLVLLASFHASPISPQLADPPPNVPAPDATPLLQHWVRESPPDVRPTAMRGWVKTPPPVQMRLGEPLRFLGGDAASGTRSHWMKLPRGVGDDPLLHTALLAYASDYFLLDMAFRAHPLGLPASSFTSTSLDHALWFHRPVRFDEWVLHTQETVAISGDRGLVRGALHDAQGQLVATAMQEVLIRVKRDAGEARPAHGARPANKARPVSEGPA